MFSICIYMYTYRKHFSTLVSRSIPLPPHDRTYLFLGLRCASGPYTTTFCFFFFFFSFWSGGGGYYFFGFLSTIRHIVDFT